MSTTDVSPPNENETFRSHELVNQIPPEARRIIEEWMQYYNERGVNPGATIVMPASCPADAGPPTRYQRVTRSKRTSAMTSQEVLSTNTPLLNDSN